MTQAPYPSIAYEFQAAARNADVAFFVGTSLRDPDMRDVCATCAGRVPTFVISRTGAYPAGFVSSRATILKDTASRFLISTFPTYLRTGNTGDLDAEAAASSDATVTEILELVALAGDGARPTKDRCEAVERLASSRVKLEREEIEELLRAPDPEVRLYALALIPDAPAGSLLLDTARGLASAQPESAFAREVQILERLMETTPG